MLKRTFPLPYLLVICLAAGCAGGFRIPVIFTPLTSLASSDQSALTTAQSLRLDPV